MILSSFRIADYYNWQGLYSGFDSEWRAERISPYPYAVEYKFNSRGFRDREWPNPIAEDTIWCFGDSFTAGIGSPVEHTWHWQLELAAGRPAITVAMDGASNQWLARKIHYLLRYLQPRNIVVHWSYLHRREADLDHPNVTEIYLNEAWKNFYSKIKQESWPLADTWAASALLSQEVIQAIINDHISQQDHFIADRNRLAVNWEVCDNWRRLWQENTHHLQDMTDFLDIIANLQDCSNIVHTFIPYFCRPEEQLKIYKELDKLKVNYIPAMPVIDLARDGHHYDILTAKQLATQVLTRLH